MRYKILLAITGLLSCLLLAAQSKSVILAPQKKYAVAYAITADKQGQAAWTEVKLINLATGEVIKSIYENSNLPRTVLDARSGRSIIVKNEQGVVADNSRMPFSTFSAACAYDRRHNRLYYTPMFINQLRYIDMNGHSPK